MFRAIVKKEYIKLKFYLFTLILIVMGVIFYFGFNLNFDFSTIEPESMMWYRFAILEEKPYFYLKSIFILFSVVIAFAQFLPEKLNSRIKILTHLTMDLKTSLFSHLLVGIFTISLLSLLTSTILITILTFYYPFEIVFVAVKDFFFYFIGAILIYLTLVSIIIDKRKVLTIFKFLFLIAFIFIFFKERYEVYDILWIIFLIWLPFLVLDSFYTIKEARINSIVFKVVTLIFLTFIIFNLYKNYINNYSKEFNRYYLFYSPIIKEFVYQKNFGGHRFEYGIKSQKFDRVKFEELLPFLYWRNLDIQNRLPIVIDNRSFDKKIIKDSRLSLAYNPKMLKDKEVKLYPLLNPNSKVSMIQFPEEAFSFGKNSINIYDFDSKMKNEKLTKEANELFKEVKFNFPAKKVFGKSTNLKPYDRGYFIIDTQNRVFNLQRVDSEFKLNEVNFNGLNIAFIKISENRAKNILGYIIDAKGEFYILNWNLNIKKLNLKGFDYKSMKLQLLSNPLYYSIRYDDGKNYHINVFDRDFNFISETLF